MVYKIPFLSFMEPWLTKKKIKDLTKLSCLMQLLLELEKQFHERVKSHFLEA